MFLYIISTSNKNDAVSLFWSLWGMRSLNIWNLNKNQSSSGFVKHRLVEIYILKEKKWLHILTPQDLFEPNFMVLGKSNKYNLNGSVK